MALKLRDLVARLRIVTDKKAAKQVEEDVTTGFGKIESFAKKAGAAIAAAFATDKLIDFGKVMISEATEAEKIWNDLANTLENVGIQLEDVQAQIELAGEAMQDTTTVSADDFAKSLDRLVSLTGDFEGALKNMQLVADVSAKFYKGELEPAVNLVAKAMNGQTKALKEVGIVTKDADEGLRMLAERSKGAAANEAETLRGKFMQIKNELFDIAENSGKALLEVANFATGSAGQMVYLNRFRLGLQGIAQWLGRIGETKEERNARIRDALNLDEWQRELGMSGTPNKITPPARPPGGPALASNILPALVGTAASGLNGRPGVAWQWPALRTVRTPMSSRDEIFQSGVESAREAFADIEDAGTNAALGIAGGFQDMFSVLINDFGNLGKAAEALGRGITGALLGGIAQFASKKVIENIALGFENIAKGKAAASTFILAPLAPGFFSAAKDNFISAGLWGLLAGGAGAAQSAVGGGGRGGVSGGIPSGAADGIGRTLENKGPQTVIVKIDPFNPRNPAHVSTGAQIVRAAGTVDSSIMSKRKAGR